MTRPNRVDDGLADDSIFAALQGMGEDDVLTPPITWGKVEAYGTIELMLASGMPVTITIRVDPVA